MQFTKRTEITFLDCDRAILQKDQSNRLSRFQSFCNFIADCLFEKSEQENTDRAELVFKPLRPLV